MRRPTQPALGPSPRSQDWRQRLGRPADQFPLTFNLFSLFLQHLAQHRSGVFSVFHKMCGLMHVRRVYFFYFLLVRFTESRNCLLCQSMQYNIYGCFSAEISFLVRQSQLKGR